MQIHKFDEWTNRVDVLRALNDDKRESCRTGMAWLSSIRVSEAIHAGICHGPHLVEVKVGFLPNQ